ncbi:MAG: hypothetical protein AAGA50_11985, partial [Pseudomonadota bacterium]
PKSRSELRNEIERYSELNGCKISKFEVVTCHCGGNDFKLFSDDQNGAAFATCASCGNTEDIWNSQKYTEKPLQNICRCGQEELALALGLSTYSNSDDIRWVYVGAHCKICRLSGVYVDWQER